MRKEIIIGILALLTAAVGIWGFYFLKGSNFLKKNNEYFVFYSDVADLVEASAVTISGYKVGNITKIELSPDNVERVKVTFQVDSDFGIPTDAIAVVRNSSVMGGRELSLELKQLCGNGIPCAPNKSELRGKELGMIGSLVDFSELNVKGSVDESLDAFTKKIRGTEEDPSELYQTFQKLDGAIANIVALTGSVNKLIVSSQKNLERTTANIESISQNLASNNEKISTILANLDVTTRKISNLDLNTTVNGANATLEETKEMARNLKQASVTANKAIADLNDVVAKMNSTEGSLGMLINDKGLYSNLEETSRELDLLIQDLRLNPKRYVNVSIIGRKDKEYALPDDDPAALDNN